MNILSERVSSLGQREFARDDPDIQEVIDHPASKGINIDMLCATRCETTTNYLEYVLDIESKLERIQTLDINRYNVFRVNICCLSIGHCFLLIKDIDGWYLCQSYIFRYPLRMDEIDIDEFISDMNTLKIKFDKDIWYRWFHVKEDETDPYIFIYISGCNL